MKEVQFTPAQLAVIDISRRGEDACVVAGPGSGKTNWLEHIRAGGIEIAPAAAEAEGA